MKNFFTIIGGMGTMATESYIHQLNLRTKAHKDQDYYNYTLVNHATVPDRTAYILDNTKQNPLPDLIEDFKQYATLGPAFFTLPCNTAHYFYDELAKVVDVPILHMPKETVAEIKKRYPKAKKVGLVATQGTIRDQIYDKEILAAGYDLAKPSPAVQKMTDELIYDDIKEQDVVDGKLFHGLVAQMIKETGCDVVILGCTELSLAQEREPITDLPLVDSQSTLVDRTIEWADKTQKSVS